MIVIPRRKGESIVLGDDIILTVIEVKGDKVRLGLDLPDGGTFQRAEVHEAIRRLEQDHAVVVLERSDGDEV